MKVIELTQNKIALVSDEDFDLLLKYKWYYSKNGKSKAYVRTTINNKKIYMHRFIMNCPIDKDVDHIDGNPLNNQRENLRICNNFENNRNQKLSIRNKSGYKGVFYDKRYLNPWRAYIIVNKKQISLGNFSTAKDAALAYNEAAIKYHKEFARLNEL